MYNFPKVSQSDNSRAGIQTQFHLIPALNNHAVLEIPFTWNHVWVYPWTQGTNPSILPQETEQVDSIATTWALE